MRNQINMAEQKLIADMQRTQYLARQVNAFTTIISQSNNARLMTYWIKVTDKISWMDNFEKIKDTWPDKKELNIFQMLARYTNIPVAEFEI